MADIGSAYLTIFPSMDGFAARLQSELNGVNVSAVGDKLGDQLGNGISDGMNKAAKSTSGFSGGLSALSGAVMGVAGEIAGRLFDAVASLGGEMVEASDSAQKFASTLSFAGIDDSTIQQLTASTQAYADQTVYDLADIRNATAQLAANGVDNYAQLAEAAGNLNAVAGGNADTFKSVSMVMSQTAGSGKLMTENWNQLTDAIPGASGALQQAMLDAGAFEGNFREAMENGEISADEFFAAVQKLGMQDVAVEAATSTSTIEGAMGNLQASVVGVGSQLITALNPVITGAMGGLTDVITGVGTAFGVVADYATSWDSIAAEMSAEMGSVATAGDMVALMLQEIGMAFGLMPEQTAPFRDAIAGIVDAFVPLGTAFQSLWTVAQPLLAQLGTAFLGLFSTLSPVIQSVASYFAAWGTTLTSIGTSIMSVLLPVLTQIVTFVTTQIMPVVVPVIQQILTTIQTAFPLIQMAITTALTVIQAIWNAVWPVLSTVVSTVFSVVSTVITTVMGVIQGIISAIMAAIQGDWSGVWSAIQGIASTIWSGIQSVISTVINAISSIISSVLSTISSIWNSVWSNVSSFVSSTWESVKSAVSSGIDGMMGFISGIPGQVMGFFADAGSWLIDAGSSIINGLKDGIMGAVGGVIDAVSGAVGKIRSFFPFSPAKRGPFSGHGYTTYSGRALMRDWAGGIASSGGYAVKAVSGVMGDVQDAFAYKRLPAISLERNPVAVSGYELGDKSGGMRVTQNFNTKVVRADEDLYTAAPIIYRNATREARLALR